MPTSRSLSVNEKGFSHILVLVVLVVLATVVGLTSAPPTKPPVVSIVSQNVLGETTLSSCSSGGLTTSTNKVFQMTYPDETFQQLTNTDLLKEVSQLKDLTCLQYLDATDRTVKGDIADLKNLVNLEVFSLYSNPDVSGDICSLANATKLRSLKFAFDPKITGDVACLKSLTKLETFAMTHTNITGDISVFANMPNLKAIYISGTYIKGDICSLKNLTNLEELGMADEYPGNPDITGDLGCLDNLKKLKRVSIYNTKTTNCEQFTKSHQGMDKTKTDSGKQGGGGCSKESMKTMVDYAQKYEAKIGKEVQTQVRGQPNYNKGGSGNPGGGPTKQPNILERFMMWLFGLFGKTPPGAPQSNGPRLEGGAGGSKNGSPLGQSGGPGGCKSKAECDAYCSDEKHQEECSKFAPAEGTNGPVEVIPDSQKGACKTEEECNALIKKKYGK